MGRVISGEDDLRMMKNFLFKSILLPYNMRDGVRGLAWGIQEAKGTLGGNKEGSLRISRARVITCEIFSPMDCSFIVRVEL